MMTLDIQKISEANHDLPERMRVEDWDVTYDKKADMVMIFGDAPQNSTYHHVDRSGFMVRVIDDSNKICGFAIEGYKSFAKENPDFYFLLMPLTNPMRFELFKSIGQVVRKFDQLKEVAEYFSSAALYQAAKA